jgi:miniconductance mechanosensitive channel
MDDAVNWLVSVGDAPYGEAVELAAIIGLCWLVHVLTRRLASRFVHHVVLKSQTEWDDALHDAKVFDRAVALVPVFVAWQAIDILKTARGDAASDLTEFVTRLVLATAIVMVVRGLLALLSAGNTIYESNPKNRDRPIKGYIQVLKIAIAVVAVVLVIAALVDESPIIFLSGLGAMTAVLLLVFRDTILSLVASVQISGNDMVRVGDWIEMPQFGADGDVTDVALHTVKVQNWDKTITTIPTHRLISDPFKNWRYMSLSGGRRIKRALYIDVSSVRFLEDGEIERFGEFRLLRDYVATKRSEIVAFNQAPERNESIDADIRRLTNLGTYRAYLELYLRAHPKIHKGMTLMVRQLAPTSEGIPLELYCFTTTTDWGEYEGIQADLFDHFIALAPQFGLRIFQTPAGSDLAALAPR